MLKQEVEFGHVTRQKKFQIKLFFQGKIISDAEMQSVSANKLFLQNKIISQQETQQEVESLQSENKINLKISQEDQLLFDALMSDNVDVHSLITDDVEHSLIEDVAVCSHAVYTRPQLTDSLGAQHACLPVCTPTTTTATTTQSPQQPLLMINDTQLPLPSRIYTPPISVLTAAHQLTTSVHHPVTGVHQTAAHVCQQSAATVYTQPACTQPSVTQLLYTQPSTTWSMHTQPTHPQPLTTWTATALSPGTQPPQPSVSAYTADVAALPEVVQPSWMLPAGAHPAQPGLLPSLDVRPACTQPPLPQPLHMQMLGARPAYTQSTASDSIHLHWELNLSVNRGIVPYITGM